MIRLPVSIKLPLVLVGLSLFAAALLLAIAASPRHGAPIGRTGPGALPGGPEQSADLQLRHAYEDAHTPNVVTVILADYRAFDTLGETVVVFTGTVCAVLLLRRRRKPA